MFAQRGIAADENLNKLYLAAIGNLETILEPVTSGKTKYAIDEKKAQELANNLVSFEHKIEFTLDEGELKREFEALKREVFIDEEDFSEITKSYITDYQTAISDLTTIEDALKEIDSLNISAEAKLEKRKELTSQYGEKLKEI